MHVKFGDHASSHLVFHQPLIRFSPTSLVHLTSLARSLTLSLSLARPITVSLLPSSSAYFHLCSRCRRTPDDTGSLGQASVQCAYVAGFFKISRFPWCI